MNLKNLKAKKSELEKRLSDQIEGKKLLGEIKNLEDNKLDKQNIFIRFAYFIKRLFGIG